MATTCSRPRVLITIILRLMPLRESRPQHTASCPPTRGRSTDAPAPARLALSAAAHRRASSGCPSLTRARRPAALGRSRRAHSSARAMRRARRACTRISPPRTAARDRNDLLLHAARAYLAARAPRMPRACSRSTESRCRRSRATERSLLGVQLALERGQAQEALRQLAGHGRAAHRGARRRVTAICRQRAAAHTRRGRTRAPPPGSKPGRTLRCCCRSRAAPPAPPSACAMAS